MIVVDASVVVSALTDRGRVGDVARQRLIEDAELHAPHLVDLEVLAVLRRKSALGDVSPQSADEVMGDVRDLAIQRYPHVPLMRRMWQLRENVTMYDASYVALAERLACPLVTSDVHLSRVPGVRCSIEVLRAP